MMRLATPTRHALQALAVLAARPATVSEVARRCGLPTAALAKTLQRLAAAGLLRSQRGPGGGYALAVDPRKVSLLSVAALLESEGAGVRRCILEERACQEAQPCRLHRAALEAEAGMRRALASLSLSELIR